MIFYKTKYLKYKRKYLQLKTQFGGETLDMLKKKITYNEYHCTNPNNFFHQHAGECWNDAIQMLICFSDEIKISVQSKLYNLTPEEIVQMAYLDNRNKFLPSIFKRTDMDEKQQLNALKFEKKLVKYLTLLQSRLCLHITNDTTDTKIINQCEKIDVNSITCPITKTFEQFLIFEKSSPDEEKTKLKLYRQKSEIFGIGSAMYGLKIANSKKEIADNKHGAAVYEMLPIINALSYSLLDDKNVLQTNFIDIHDLTKSIVDNCLGAIIITAKHATAFFTCDKKEIYYDDNIGSFLFNWRQKLTEYLCYIKTHSLFLYPTIDGFVPIYQDNQSKRYFVMNNGLEETSIVKYLNIKKYIINGLIIINKINLKDADKNVIYSTLENQFVITNLLNNSIDNIKNPTENFVNIIPLNYVALNMNIDLFIKMMKTIKKSDLNIIKNVLFDSIDKQKFDVVKYLVPEYVSSDIADNENNTLLTRIINKKIKIYNEDDECNELKIIDYLIKQDANLQYLKLDNYNAFEHALIKRKINVLKLFINNKYDINIPNYENDTPFIFLSKRKDMIDKDLIIIKILINGGININQKDTDGYTILEYLSSKYKQSELEIELIKIIKLQNVIKKTTDSELQKNYIDLIINSNNNNSIINTLTKTNIIHLLNNINEFNIENIDISNEMKKIFFSFNIMLVELNEQTIINMLPYLHKNNFSEYCPYLTQKYKFILNKILCKYENNSAILKNIVSNFKIDDELLFELFTKLNERDAYLAFMSRISKDYFFLVNALENANFKNKEKILNFFKKVKNTNLKIFSFGGNIFLKIMKIIINDFLSNKNHLLIKQKSYEEEHSKFSDIINKQISEKDRIYRLFTNIQNSIYKKAKRNKIYDVDINKISIKSYDKIKEINERIPKTIQIEKKLIEDDYNKINQIKTQLKTKITTNPDSIILSDEDIKIMGRTGVEADPLIFIAHGSLTGTYFYLNNKNISIYTIVQPGTILSIPSFNIEDELMSKISDVIDQPYEKIIDTMETQLKEIFLQSIKKNSIMFPVKFQNNSALVKKHVKSTSKKYIMNDMYISFSDKKRNVYAYNLINEAKNRKSFAVNNEEFNKNHIKNENLYVPPHFLSCYKDTTFLLSDLINFYGERPYVLFNCRTKNIKKIETTDYLSNIYERQNKFYIQPILSRKISNLDNFESDEDIEKHKFLSKYKNI